MRKLLLLLFGLLPLSIFQMNAADDGEAYTFNNNRKMIYNFAVSE